MLLSLGLIIIIGMTMGYIARRLTLPPLIGYLFTGVVLGPSVSGILDQSLLDISPDIRVIILVIILTRAGLSLDLGDLRQVGRPAMLLSFVPALFEIGATAIFAPKILGISRIDALVLGGVLGAVSPAVIVPRMVSLIDKEIGTKKSIPQMILAAASIDDIIVIVIFTSLLDFALGGSFNAMTLIGVPVSIILGGLIGFLLARILYSIISNIDRASGVGLILAIGMVLLYVEDYFPISGLIGIMAFGVTIFARDERVAGQLSSSYNSLWKIGEILLFALVGAEVSIDYALSFGWMPVVLLVLVVAIRVFGVFLCLLGTDLNPRERLFAMISYTPKATVQAAIGGIPLAMGLDSGMMILTVAVLSILITAPIGAWAMDISYKKLLS